jgi:hypothetical protein
MITVLFLASHILRLAEPAVFSVRFSGELTRSEAREILHIAREHIAGRPGRILLDLALLDNVPEDCAALIDELLAEARADVHVRYVAIVRAQPGHRTFLPTSANEAEPLVVERASDARPNLYLRYFAGPGEALVWLRLPADLLWASHEAIYLTHYF